MRTNKNQYVDPDPLVVDLLVNLAATGVAGLLVKVGHVFYSSSWWRRRSSMAPALATQVDQQTIEDLHKRVEDLESLTKRAFQLVKSNGRRELGGVLLLDSNRIEQYHELRESLFSLLRVVDKLTEGLSLQSENLEPEDRSETNLPRDFRSQVRFIENRLIDARVASIAEEAFLEINSAIVGMRRLLEHIRYRAQRNR